MGYLTLFNLGRTKEVIDVGMVERPTDVDQPLLDEFGKVVLHAGGTASDVISQSGVGRPAMVFFTSVIAQEPIQKFSLRGDRPPPDEIRDNKAANISFGCVGIHILSLSSCILWASSRMSEGERLSSTSGQGNGGARPGLFRRSDSRPLSGVSVALIAVWTGMVGAS